MELVPDRPKKELPQALKDAQWKPGVGGGGQRKGRGLARKIRDVIGDDPTTVIEVLYDIAVDPRARPADRISASRELLDRAYGRAPSYAPIESGDPLEMNALDKAIVEIATRLKEAQPAPASAELGA